ncbi:carboxypeptidase-like regulatory domain-containing protein [Pseudocnuella soli]|uniref:carboxypeptidase-like regulatory domain-containing protein n=1 Tax=Pseudocnuella soli TaxID=2502779 RepID=UPI0010477E7B|nr:carboxypeptidase-like regulatory domain-containing protein [Pseudocnuella soli]
MRTKISVPLISIMLIMLLSYKNIEHNPPIEVTGIVLDAHTRKPLPQLHVYASKGEEEAFTNDKGAFQFTSWQELPLTITVRGNDKKDKQVRVDSAPVQVTILLP